MVEVVDRPLQVPEGALVAVVIAGGVFHRPHHHWAADIFGLRQRPDRDTVPAGAFGLAAAESADDAAICDGTAAILGSAGQEVNRFAGIGVASKQPCYANRNTIGQRAAELTVLPVRLGDLAVQIGADRP